MLIPVIHSNKLPSSSKMGRHWPIWQRPIKENTLLWRYLHTYNLDCFHYITIHPYDKTPGKVKRLVALTYLSRSQRLINEADKKVSPYDSSTPTICCFHINTSDPYDETKVKFKGCQGQRQRLLNLTSYNLYGFRIQNVKHCHHDISKKTVGQGVGRWARN